MHRFLAAAILAAALAGPAQAAEPRVILSQGHTDVLELTYENGALVLRLKDDTGEPVVHRQPSDVILHAKPESRFVIPEGLPESYAFLGRAGDVRWMLPEVGEEGILWPGWTAEEVPRGIFDNDGLTWHMLGLNGPGQLKLFVSGLVDPIVFFDTANPLPQTLDIGLSHNHANWVFTAEGLYRMTVEVTGTLVGGGTLSTGPADYCFYVGDLAGLPTDPSQSVVSIAGMEAEYQAGQQVTLRAAQSPETCLGGYRWHARCGEAADFSEVATGTTHAFPAEVARDGCQYRVTLHDTDGSVVSTSAPVTLRVRQATSPPEPPAPPAGAPPEQPAARRPGALALTLSLRRPPRLGTLARSGRLPVQCRLDGAGTCSIRAWVAASDARRLGLGRRTATLGRGERRLAGPGAATVSVKLNRRALRRAGRRLRVHLTGTATTQGRPPATRSAALTLRR